MSTNTLKDTQLKQLKNISDTLIEATEHFITYIRNREYVQSIHLFSSIVEGFEAIYKTLHLHNHHLTGIENLLGNIEKSLKLIAKQLEEKNDLKITEIVQFSLMPHLKKLNQSFADEPSEQKKTTIGFYLDSINPIKAYPRQKIEALTVEGDRQQARLLFFSAEDVDFEHKKIQADVYENNEWKKITTPFPDVIHNFEVASKHQQSITERKLRRLIPFTNFGVGNKFALPKTIVKHKRFAHLLVPFRMITDEKIVFNFLKKEKTAVLKPILGAQGAHIYFVKQKGTRFIVYEHQQKKIFHNEAFQQWLKATVLARKYSYMIQRYIKCRTKYDEPFDIRSHMQKNREGSWVITKIYPRIGSNKSILSNISRGGRTEDLKTFLSKEFGELKGRLYYEQLEKLSYDLTTYLDRIYHFSLNDVGLDIAIDQTGRFWLHEANNDPGATFHEHRRAIHTIGYAKYIAEQGIVKHSPFEKTEGQFDANTSDLPVASIDHRHRIGMLKGKNDDDRLALACAYVAHYENVQFFTFTPKDIDFDAMLIKGQFFEDGTWVEKIVEYPEVIYDRLRLRRVKGFHHIYEELNGIPFTNEFDGISISKLEVYDQLKATGQLNDVIIPYQAVSKTYDIFQYIRKYHSIIIKPSVSSFAKGVHHIEKLSDDNYLVVQKDAEATYSDIALRKYLNQLINSGTWIVQQYINTRTIDNHPFDLRVHMMKDGNGKWKIAHIYPRVGVNRAIMLVQRHGGYVSHHLSAFLKRNFGEKYVETIEKKITSVSHRITKTFAKLYTHRFHELALDLALNEQQNPYLIEVNVNKPGVLNYEFDVARYVIPYAIYLAKQHTSKNSNPYQETLS